MCVQKLYNRDLCCQLLSLFSIPSSVPVLTFLLHLVFWKSQILEWNNTSTHNQRHKRTLYFSTDALAGIIKVAGSIDGTERAVGDACQRPLITPTPTIRADAPDTCRRLTLMLLSSSSDYSIDFLWCDCLIQRLHWDQPVMSKVCLLELEGVLLSIYIS